MTTSVRIGPPTIAAPPPAAANAGAWRLIASRVLISVAVLAAWIVLYVLVLSRFEAANAQRALYDRFRTELALGEAPTTEAVPAGDPLALLEIPGAGIHNLVVVEGTTSEQLADGPGHFRNTVLPGQRGLAAVGGKSLSYGAPFAHLTDLQPGDGLTAVTGQGRFTYRVLDVRRDGDPVPTADRLGQSALVLTTAEGDGPFGALAPGRAVYVDAVLQGTPAAPRATGGGLTTQERPLARDTSALTLAELLLALQAVAAALCLLVWARAKWSRQAAWVAGTPVVVAALWLATSIAARLVPNLT